MESPEYEAGTTVRRVKTNGEIKWNGERVYLSESLRGESVGLMPVDERYWSIRYGPLNIGLLTVTLIGPCIHLLECYLCPRSKCYPCARSYSEHPLRP